MKIFVTGATGFIGRNLVETFDKHGHNITINLRPGKESPFNSNINIYTLGKSNIELDIEFFKNENFDGIIHLASLYLTSHKPEEIHNLIDSNVKFGTYLLECASKAPIGWFINTGTFWQNYQNSTYSPVNLYAATKQAFESIARYYIETNQLMFCTLRLADTFGPNDSRPKIFSLWEKIAKTGETLPMSEGNQILDINHIDNVIHAYLTLSNLLHNNDNRLVNGDVFALKAEKRYTLRELSKLYERIMEIKLNIKWGKRDYREREVMIPWEQGVSIPGYAPVTSIEDGLIQMKCP